MDPRITRINTNMDKIKVAGRRLLKELIEEKLTI